MLKSRVEREGSGVRYAGSRDSEILMGEENEKKLAAPIYHPLRHAPPINDRLILSTKRFD
jgi:hypothetical protein